jgi:hypothetical protein
VEVPYAHAKRNCCTWLRRYCDNLDEFLFLHVPSEPQIEWFLTALWLGMMPAPVLKVKFRDSAGQAARQDSRVGCSTLIQLKTRVNEKFRLDSLCPTSEV